MEDPATYKHCCKHECFLHRGWLDSDQTTFTKWRHEISSCISHSCPRAALSLETTSS